MADFQRCNCHNFAINCGLYREDSKELHVVPSKVYKRGYHLVCYKDLSLFMEALDKFFKKHLFNFSWRKSEFYVAGERAGGGLHA